MKKKKIKFATPLISSKEKKEVLKVLDSGIYSQGKKCKESFLNRFQKGNIPDDIDSVKINIDGPKIMLVNLLKDANMISSVSEGNRLIKQGGIKINSEKVEDPKLEVSEGSEDIYQVGKRKFLKIKL